MRIALAIATLGRADLLTKTLPVWKEQTRAPDRFVISATSEADVGDSLRNAPPADVVFGSKGLCAQRNRALELLAGDCDVVVFVDDDYVPCRTFIEETFKAFTQEPDIVAATGHVVADGITTGGIDFDAALAMARAHEKEVVGPAHDVTPNPHCYGCNMMLRVSVAPGLRFDERLPLYGWQEDLDFSRRIGAFGRIVRTWRVAGVHMGSTGGRSSGLRLGYSQIANPIYLAQKRSMTWREAALMASKNVAANAAKSLRPEPWVDRWGRLRGNLLALTDALRNRMRPERILEL